MPHEHLWRRSKHLQPLGRSRANSSQRHTLNGSPRRDPHKDRVSVLKEEKDGHRSAARSRVHPRRRPSITMNRAKTVSTGHIQNEG